MLVGCVKVQTEKQFYRVYPLDIELKLHLNVDSSLHAADKMNDDKSSKIMKVEPIEEEIDAQTEKEFFEDIDPSNIPVEDLVKQIKRYQRIVNFLKAKYEYKCQLCGAAFLMDNGKQYCEAHHIKMLSQGGSQSPDNVIILCANHHREFHYARNTIVIGEPVEGKRALSIGSEKYVVAFG